MAASALSEGRLKSPLRKLVVFFERSRDNWKAKYLRSKRALKYEQNQRRAVEKSRAHWRQQAESLDWQVRQLQQALAESKTGL